MAVQISIRPAIHLGVITLVVLICILSGVALVRSSSAAGSVVYVKPGGAGARTGLDWANAKDLQAALTAATAWTEIWVAKGVYKPTASAAERAMTFQLKSGVAVYGGFAGTETALGQRNWAANVTVLSGDIDGNDAADASGVVRRAGDIVGSNSYHVVTASGTDATAVLDGVIVTAGQADVGGSATGRGGGAFADAGSPTLMNVTICGNRANEGAGMYNYDGSSPTLANVTFSGNTASTGGGMRNVTHSSPTLTNVTISGNRAIASSGGGMDNTDNSSPRLTNVTISGNRALFGGGMYNYGSSSPALTNVTISGNRADLFGGGMANCSTTGSNPANPTIRNSIVWGNVGGGTTTISNRVNGQATVSYSLVEGTSLPAGTIDGGHNILGADALFAVPVPTVSLPTTAGDLRLKVGSPAIDSGDNATVTVATDRAGRARIVGSAVDLGADEAGPTIYVNGNAPAPAPSCGGIANGTAWACAYRDLQQALAAAVAGTDSRIVVARGVYTPTASAADRLATFQLKNGVAIYGGFAGPETALGQRNWVANVTVLSGDIDGNDAADANGVVRRAGDIVGSNSYHVVTASGTDATAVLDGVTVTAGQADGASGPTGRGGGVYADAGSPTLMNVTISGNGANDGGGMHNTNSSPTLANVTISGNSAASGGGGGMYNRLGSSPTLANVTISGNGAGWGGGMYNYWASSPTLTNVMISGNSAASGGGGGVLNDFGCNPTLTNVTVSGNSAAENGGGITNLRSSSATLVNAIVWGNVGLTIYNELGTQATVSYSLVEGTSLPAGTIDGGHNILGANPLFVVPVPTGSLPTTAGDLRPRAGSPAVDSGSNAAVTTATDRDGHARIVGGAVDMGAYEWALWTFLPLAWR